MDDKLTVAECERINREVEEFVYGADGPVAAPLFGPTAAKAAEVRAALEAAGVESGTVGLFMLAASVLVREWPAGKVTRWALLTLRRAGPGEPPLPA
jgi:hypothetical protein